MKDLLIKLGVASPGAVSISTMLESTYTVLQFTGLFISVVGGGILFYCEYRNKKLIEQKLKKDLE
jgi:hypothetical protein